MNYYQVQLDDGMTILMEAIDDMSPANPYMVPAGKEEKVATTIETTFEKLFSPVLAFAKKVNESLKKVHGPDEVELEFAVKLSTEAGALIAKAGTEGSATIKLTWKKAKDAER